MRLSGRFLTQLIVQCAEEAIFSLPTKTIRLFFAAIRLAAVKNTVEERYDLLNIAHVCIYQCVHLDTHIRRHFIPLVWIAFSYCACVCVCVRRAQPAVALHSKLTAWCRKRTASYPQKLCLIWK